LLELAFTKGALPEEPPRSSHLQAFHLQSTKWGGRAVADGVLEVDATHVTEAEEVLIAVWVVARVVWAMSVAVRVGWLANRKCGRLPACKAAMIRLVLLTMGQRPVSGVSVHPTRGGRSELS